MLLIPLATFYVSYYVLFKQNQEMLAWSGILAVIATNCVIVAYVMMAWGEDDVDMKRENREAESNCKTD